jgi:DNA polymerase III psi subunit
MGGTKSISLFEMVGKSLNLEVIMMRKLDFEEIQQLVQSKQSEVNLAVFAYKQQLLAQGWQEKTGRVRDAGSRKALDEALLARFRWLEEQGIVHYDEQKRVMTIANLEYL